MEYPDLQFVLSLLIKGEYYREAALLLREMQCPLELSVVHQVQIENGLLRGLHNTNPAIAESAQGGLRLWQQYLLEQVFTIRSFDLEEVFVRAAAWNANYRIQPPKWSLLIHVAVAAETEATFMSFDPALRKCAADAGLRLLPERL